MAFKERQELSSDVAISLGGFNRKTNKDNPTKIQGYFLGSKAVKSAKSTTGFSQLHTFQTPDGNVGVWGKIDLDAKLSDPTLIGTMVRITCMGLVPTKSGNEMYRFKVEVDEDNRIDTASENEGDDGYTDEEEEEVLDEVVPTRAAPRSTAPTTTSKQVTAKALLAKGRNVQA